MKKYFAAIFVVTAFAAAAYAADTEQCKQKCMKLVKEKARCACVCDNECDNVEPIKRDKDASGADIPSQPVPTSPAPPPKEN